MLNQQEQLELKIRLAGARAEQMNEILRARLGSQRVLLANDKRRMDSRSAIAEYPVGGVIRGEKLWERREEFNVEQNTCSALREWQHQVWCWDGHDDDLRTPLYDWQRGAQSLQRAIDELRPALLFLDLQFFTGPERELYGTRMLEPISLNSEWLKKDGLNVVFLTRYEVVTDLPAEADESPITVVMRKYPFVKGVMNHFTASPVSLERVMLDIVAFGKSDLVVC